MINNCVYGLKHEVVGKDGSIGRKIQAGEL